MDSFELQNGLVLLAGTAAVIGLVALMVATILHRARAKAEPAKAPMQTPEFGAVKRSDAPPPAVDRPPQPVAPPTRIAVPNSAPQASPQSYAAVAAAQARDIPKTPAASPARPVIDYTNALAGIRPDASYTSAAIATLLGMATNPRPSPAEARVADSYAAIAARSASLKPRTEVPPASNRIDYSRELAHLPPNASYAAIAVAAAAQQR